MFDAHCHLNDEVFNDSLNSVMYSARESGVVKLLIPSTNLFDFKKALKIATEFEGVFLSIGIHPTEKLEDLGDIGYVREKIQKPIDENAEIVAIGECGLDYYKYKSPASLQKEFLEMQIKLAIINDLAVIIHNRHATQELLPILNKCIEGNFNRIVFHACPAENELLEFAIQNNIYIGIGGDVTYDKTKALFISKVPLSLLLLETDSPNLTPLPIRNTKKFPNTPENLRYTAEKVSNIKKVDVSEIIHITSQNAEVLFLQPRT